MAAVEGTPCRDAVGTCDVAEVCDGSSTTCPADALESSGTECRAADGDCDVVETCSGSSAECPADDFAASGTECRPAAGDCDVAETCDGSNAGCPADDFAASGTVCRADTGDCDVEETCSGSSPTCPSDSFEIDGSTCDDGNACTGEGSCDTGVCASGDDTDGCAENEVCNPEDGECELIRNVVKTLDEGANPVGTAKDSQSVFVFTIALGEGYDPTIDVTDVVPAEFDCAETTLAPSCGTATCLERNKPGDKLRPDHVVWDLDGGTACAGEPATLTLTIMTDLNPGKGHAKRGRTVYEPTSCGPLSLNDGATAVFGVCDDETCMVGDVGAACAADTDCNVPEISNSLFVATCRDEADPEGCIDDDGDGWSTDCGDCDDTDALVNPDAVEVCDDGIDNDCNELVDCDDPACGTAPACIEE